MERHKKGLPITNLVIASGIAYLLWPSPIWLTVYLFLLLGNFLLASLFLLPGSFQENEIINATFQKLPAAALSNLMVLLLVGWGGGIFSFGISVATALVSILVRRKFLSRSGFESL